MYTPNPLQRRRLFILGLGSQGKAWAQNWRDQKLPFQILLREKSSTIQEAKKLELPVTLFNEWRPEPNDIFIMLIPDHTHKNVLAFFAQQGGDIPLTFIYAHGVSYTQYNWNQVYPAWSHLLLAPKAIASEVRANYLSHEPLAAVYSTEGSIAHDAKELVFFLAGQLGINQGPFKSTFREETLADLFSEQALLCSLLPYGARLIFEKMVERGISREVAYLECWREVKLIADAMIKFGPENFHRLISPNALYGGEKARHVIFDKSFHDKLDTLAADIWSGSFFNEVMDQDLDALRQSVIADWSSTTLAQTHKAMEKKGVDL
ncbi:MAG: hypothetical protein A2X86_07805 [Bdellovibrionales bacterium GWA2_49_15]|nr:MAG: hypothetical protein A2X86_07805 [Bdellovibrionales bacterium GWA2_49_15]HAZ11817.1 hypothetical protein [Bdellovibrionales bacterium]